MKQFIFVSIIAIGVVGLGFASTVSAQFAQGRFDYGYQNSYGYNYPPTWQQSPSNGYVCRTYFVNFTPPASVREGDLYTYQVYAYSPDRIIGADRTWVPVSYRLTEAPQGMTIDEKTGVIRWTPAWNQGGRAYTARVAAYNGTCETAQSFTVTVVDVDGSGVPTYPMYPNYPTFPQYPTYQDFSTYSVPTYNYPSAELTEVVYSCDCVVYEPGLPNTGGGGFMNNFGTSVTVILNILAAALVIGFVWVYRKSRAERVVI